MSRRVLNDEGMRRNVTAHVEANVSSTADITWSVAVSAVVPRATEQITVTVDGSPVEVEEIVDGMTRLHRCREVPAGNLVLDYRCTVDEQAPEPDVTLLDEVVFLRPSRYVDSDTMAPVATATFAGQQGKQLLDSVALWVNQSLQYVSGSSRPTDGAVDTYLSRQGVCRDFAHLVIAMLRGLNVPARLVSVYAPGLSPMDFHAVAEALIDGKWQVVDATSMAPRTAMLRIATGRDASDTAFMTVAGGQVELGLMEVTAVAEPALPVDDSTMLTQLR